jgi:hypothetical protein
MDRSSEESFFRIIYLQSSEATVAADDTSNPFQYRLAVPLSILQMHSPALTKIASDTPMHADCVIPLPVVPYVSRPLLHALSSLHIQAFIFAHARRERKLAVFYDVLPCA